MAFLTYKKTAAGGKASYERLKSLRLGGRDGLLARHIKSLLPPNQGKWKLDCAGLLKLADINPAEENVTVLFDVAGRDATSVCLYELVKIHGSCRDTSTQLALDFAVVLDQEMGAHAPDYARRFEVDIPAEPRLLAETLSLSGGPGGGDWKWGAPPMQLGATVVHGKNRRDDGRRTATA